MHELYLDDGSADGELYDLSADPAQTDPLFHAPDTQGVVRDFRDQCLNRLIGSATEQRLKE